VFRFRHEVCSICLRVYLLVPCGAKERLPICLSKKQTHSYACVKAQARTRAHIHTHTHIHACTHTDTRARTHTQTHTDTRARTQTRNFPCKLFFQGTRKGKALTPSAISMALSEPLGTGLFVGNMVLGLAVMSARRSSCQVCVCMRVCVCVCVSRQAYVCVLLPSLHVSP
jgi:hypothetical protein